MEEPGRLLKLQNAKGTSRPDGGERSSRSMDAESRPGPVVTVLQRSFLELPGDGIRVRGLMPVSVRKDHLARHCRDANAAIDHTPAFCSLRCER